MSTADVDTWLEQQLGVPYSLPYAEGRAVAARLGVPMGDLGRTSRRITRWDLAAVIAQRLPAPPAPEPPCTWVGHESATDEHGYCPVCQ